LAKNRFCYNKKQTKSNKKFFHIIWIDRVLHQIDLLYCRKNYLFYF